MLFAFLAAPALAQKAGDPAKIDKAFHDDISELLHLMDSERMTSQMVDFLVQEWQDQYPDMPEEFWDKFGKEFKPEDFIELAIPVYAKYLSRPDVAALLEFYRSPVGRTFVLTQGALQEDLVTVGEDWSKQVATRFIEKLRNQKPQ
jgi:hypothetical protein